MITKEQGQHIAQAWVDAWNAHDIDAIMAHYSDQIQFWSPLIIKRLGIASGNINDKAQLKAYFEHGLATIPNLHFTLVKVFCGVDSITILYRRHDGVEVTEVMALDGDLVCMVRAHYEA